VIKEEVIKMNEKSLGERLDLVNQRLSVLCKVLEHWAEEQGANKEDLEVTENE